MRETYTVPENERENVLKLLARYGKKAAAYTKGWVYGWQKKGWIKSDKKPALNVDLWKQLLPLLEKHKVNFVWVKGHAGHPENERCDQLAVIQRDLNA